MSVHGKRPCYAGSTLCFTLPTLSSECTARAIQHLLSAAIQKLNVCLETIETSREVFLHTIRPPFQFLLVL